MSSTMQEQDHSRFSSASDHSSSGSKDAAAAGPWQEHQQQETAAAENADVAAIGGCSCSMCWQWTYRSQGEHNCSYMDPLAWQATADMELSRCLMVVQ